MSELSGIMRVALEVAARRRDTLAQIEQALDRGDEQAALRLIREYIAMEPKEHAKERDRVN